MEILDNIQAWQIEVGDLVQFGAYDDDEPFVELLTVADVTVSTEAVVVIGESLVSGDQERYVLDPYLDIEIMGA